jgi:hypothetical protein
MDLGLLADLRAGGGAIGSVFESHALFEVVAQFLEF